MRVGAIPDPKLRSPQVVSAIEKRAESCRDVSAWKEARVVGRLPVGVALIGGAGVGKSALYESLRREGPGAAEPRSPGLPTLETRECLLTLSGRQPQLNLVDTPGIASAQQEAEEYRPQTAAVRLTLCTLPQGIWIEERRTYVLGSSTVAVASLQSPLPIRFSHQWAQP